jgi:dTDP-glucose 4,6-dehydratase
MKILVTGGAGFIGSNFIKYFLENHPSSEVVNLDVLTYAGNLENLKTVKHNPRYEFIKADICDYEIVKKTMERCSAVLNFAAESHVDRSISNTAAFIRTNIVGTHILLEVARELNIKRFLQISTDEVYGSIENGSFTEESVLNPSSPYSVSKASADLLCLAYYKTYKLPTIITRSSNNYGPCQYPEKIIPLFITNILKNKKVPVYAKGLNIRDWLYVEDNCAAIDTVLQKGTDGNIYNIAAGQEMTNIELTEKILKSMGKAKDWIEYVQDRPGHDFRYSVNFSKIKLLGWRPRVDFEQGLIKTIEWYKEHAER